MPTKEEKPNKIKEACETIISELKKELDRPVTQKEKLEIYSKINSEIEQVKSSMLKMLKAIEVGHEANRAMTKNLERKVNREILWDWVSISFSLMAMVMALFALVVVSG
jgi:chromosome segregation ATPase